MYRQANDSRRKPQRGGCHIFCLVASPPIVTLVDLVEYGLDTPQMRTLFTHYVILFIDQGLYIYCALAPYN